MFILYGYFFHEQLFYKNGIFEKVEIITTGD